MSTFFRHTMLILANEGLLFDRHVPRKPRPLGRGQRAPCKRKLPCREALRHAQGRELSRTAPPFRDCVVIGRMAKTVMLNLFQHLIESNTYETLNQVQGDKKGVAIQSQGGERWGEGVDIEL